MQCNKPTSLTYFICNSDIPWWVMTHNPSQVSHPSNIPNLHHEAYTFLSAKSPKEKLRPAVHGQIKLKY